jgi:hypothetical protein
MYGTFQEMKAYANQNNTSHTSRGFAIILHALAKNTDLLRGSRPKIAEARVQQTDRQHANP